MMIGRCTTALPADLSPQEVECGETVLVTWLRNDTGDSHFREHRS